MRKSIRYGMKEYMKSQSIHVVWLQIFKYFYNKTFNMHYYLPSTFPHFPPICFFINKLINWISEQEKTGVSESMHSYLNIYQVTCIS